MTLLGILWFALIFVLIAGYFVLDGFDLGSGALYPFVAKNEKEKAVVRQAVGPVWDGNEVWLLTAGGALFAAFAPAYATTFSGFYLAIMLVLFSLIVRGISLEFRAHDKAWEKIWDFLFFIGSALPALLFGVAAGNVFAGIPLNAQGDYTGIPLFGLLSPFTLGCGVLGLAIFIAQGASWLALKTEKETALYKRVARVRSVSQIVSLVLFVVVALMALTLVSSSLAPELAWGRYLFLVVFVLACVLALAAGKKACDIGSFVCNSLCAVALVGLWACCMFPNLVVATQGASITIATAASSDLSLAWMTGITCAGLPLVLIYHVLIYKTFAGRISENELEEY